ncbi:putative Diaminohydroxyphosphoribosylaminopyrimidine deaminase [Candidatus Sulfopaludibacter sp. SbA6]|nr:putative Diaminohydroxyphosphoribosylaminopyrimidine deaminase [Candidatus Sulfopaludibacter sp. SbA6]
MAIEEALKSVPEDERPHPKVGAVVVKNGQVLSKAHRGEILKSHAEYIALDEKLSDDLIAGATVYTTLEPCTTRNHPRTPCAQRLIDRKVARVVVGMLDPNPNIRGLGAGNWLCPGINRQTGRPGRFVGSAGRKDQSDGNCSRRRTSGRPG